MQTTQAAISLLNQLKKSDIAYALIRNFDCLINRQKFNEKDVDALICKKDKQKIFETMRKKGFKKLLICPSAGHYGFVKYITGHFLSFHLHAGGISGSSINYMDAESVLLRRKEKNNLFILSEEDQLLALILHSFLDSCSFREKYRQQINHLIRKALDFDYVYKKLSEISSNAFAKRITEYILQKKYKKLENLRERFRKKFYYGNKKRILLLLKTNLHKYAWALWRLTKNAPLVSFIGMDGAGKTTMTNMLKEKLDNSLITSSLIYTGRGRNNILPIQFFGRKYQKIVNDRNKAARKNSDTEISFKKKIICTLAAPLFALDLFLRYWLIIWPKRKIKQIILTDRYSTDILLMANVPFFLKSALHIFFPKPQKIIYLYHDLQVLKRRKKDHSLFDLKRQQKLFRKINKKIKPISVRNADIQKTFDKVARASFKLIGN